MEDSGVNRGQMRISVNFHQISEETSFGSRTKPFLNSTHQVNSFTKRRGDRISNLHLISYPKKIPISSPTFALMTHITSTRSSRASLTLFMTPRAFNQSWMESIKREDPIQDNPPKKSEAEKKKVICPSGASRTYTTVNSCLREISALSR